MSGWAHPVIAGVELGVGMVEVQVLFVMTMNI